MSVLKLGDVNSDIAMIQRKLNYVLHLSLKEDGIFGRETERAVKAFQTAHSLLPDGIIGPQTIALLNSMFDNTYYFINETSNQLDTIYSLIDTLVGLNIVYGPGRGLFKDGKWIVTNGPGALNLKWSSITQAYGPSFHCSSLVNFILSYLYGYNDPYTHAGNCPTLFRLLDSDDTLHPVDATGKLSGERFRGFAGKAFRLASDGDTVKRLPSMAFDKAHKYLDTKEIIDRFDELSNLNVWSQTFKLKGKYHWDSHVGFFVKRNGELFRLASDGYTRGNQWSATPLSYKKFTMSDNLYQVFKLDINKITNTLYPVVTERQLYV